MATSALFVMDLKGKIIISRNYRGDVPMSVSERCVWGRSDSGLPVLATQYRRRSTVSPAQMPGSAHVARLGGARVGLSLAACTQTYSDGPPATALFSRDLPTRRDILSWLS